MENIENVIRTACRLVEKYGTRDPFELCRARDITVMELPFRRQKGAYKIIQRNPFIYLKEDLPEGEKRLVLAHELGHDLNHRSIAAARGGFQEFELFNMREGRMEYEANVSCAEILLPDDEVVEYIQMGYDLHQIARAMRSDINLLAVKVDNLICKGYPFHMQEHRNDFLRYDRPNDFDGQEM